MESLRRTCRGGTGSKAGTGLASIAFGYPKRDFGENPKPPEQRLEGLSQGQKKI